MNNPQKEKKKKPVKILLNKPKMRTSKSRYTMGVGNFKRFDQNK
jgi:hypothetical protein